MECSICYKEVNDKDYAITSCNHVFCIECMKTYKKNSCPMCRQVITDFKIPFISLNNVDKEVVEKIVEVEKVVEKIVERIIYTNDNFDSHDQVNTNENNKIITSGCTSLEERLNKRKNEFPWINY